MVQIDIRTETLMKLEKLGNLDDHLFILHKEHLQMPVIKLTTAEKTNNKCYVKEGQKIKCDNA